MKKYILMLIIPFMMLASCMKDESAYLPQEKEDVKVDNVNPDDGGDEPDVPIDGVLTPGVHLIKMTINGLERRFKYFMPVSIDPTKPISLVFELHGSYKMEEGAEGIPDPISGINSKNSLCQQATKDNFIAVFPAGVFNGTSVDWSKDGYMDGIPFIDAIIEFFKRSTPLIDSNRIYTTGQSSGAIFSCVLAFHRSEVIAAVAPRAGRMNISEETVMPTRAVPIRMFLGVTDDIVNHEGAVNDMILWAEKIGGYFPNDMVKSKEPFMVEKYNKNVNTRKFNGCKTDIEIYSIEDEGHGVSDVYMMPYIWEFMKAHVKNNEPENLYVSAQDTLITLNENETYVMKISYNDDASFSFVGVDDWTIVQENKTLRITAPVDFFSSVAEGSIILKSERNGEIKTRKVEVKLNPKKTFFNVGEIYYNNNKEAVGVVCWVNPKNKREAKIINLQEVTTQGTYETINYGKFGATFFTPDLDNGENNTALSMKQKEDKNLDLNNRTSGLVWAATYSYKGVTGWYLPALNELAYLDSRLTLLNPIIASIEGRELNGYKNASDGGYLTSSVLPNATNGKEFKMFNFFNHRKIYYNSTSDNTPYYRARAMKKVTL